MNAEQARIQSDKAARKIAQAERRKAATARIFNQRAKLLRHQNYERKLYFDLKQRIKTAADYGKQSITHDLQENCGSLVSARPEEFLKRFEFRDELLKVINKLKKEGYQAEIQGKVTSHDESVAYMNSGGECGRNDIYYTHDVVLEVQW
jgi:hypothetical protein